MITGLLPCDPQPSIRRKIIKEVNDILEFFCSSGHQENIFYLKPDCDWIHKNGTLNETYFHTDDLHLNRCGNHKFALAITNKINTLLSTSYPINSLPSSPTSPSYPVSLGFWDNLPEPLIHPAVSSSSSIQSPSSTNHLLSSSSHMPSFADVVKSSLPSLPCQTPPSKPPLPPEKLPLLNHHSHRHRPAARCQTPDTYSSTSIAMFTSIPA